MHQGTRATTSPVAQRKRAVKHRHLPHRHANVRFEDGYRLMSRRSHDRNMSGEHKQTGMAQRQRARLITARTLDQNQFSVSNHSVALQKLLVITTLKRNRYSSAAEHLKHRPLSTRHANVRIWRWLSPYKRKVTGSKPVAGISSFSSFTETTPRHYDITIHHTPIAQW